MEEDQDEGYFPHNVSPTRESRILESSDGSDDDDEEGSDPEEPEESAEAELGQSLQRNINTLLKDVQNDFRRDGTRQSMCSSSPCRPLSTSKADVSMSSSVRQCTAKEKGTAVWYGGILTPEMQNPPVTFVSMPKVVGEKTLLLPLTTPGTFELRGRPWGT
jgi:hypothetical protein